MFEHLHTDRGIVQRVLRGHQDSFRVLVDRYGSMVYGVAYAHVGNAADAEEVAQEAFVRLYQWLDRLNRTESVAAWLVRVARNVAVDILRRRSREVPLDETADAIASVRPNSVRTEIHKLVWVEISSLEAADREILVLYYFRSRRAKEIAQILGITPQAAAKRIQRARAELGRRLENVMGDAFASGKEDPARTKRIMAAVAVTPTAWKASASLALSGAVVTGSTFSKAVTGLAACLLLLLAGFFGWRHYSHPYDTQDITAKSTFSAKETLTAASSTGLAANTGPVMKVNASDNVPATAPDPAEPPPYEPAVHPSIRGEVVMDDGRPVPNVPVLLQGGEGLFDPISYRPESFSVEMTQVTDANGQFSFPTVPPSLNGVRVSAQYGTLYGEKMFGPILTLPDIYLELTLAPDATLRFRVTDEANSPIVAPVENARVQIQDSFPLPSRLMELGFPDEDGWVRYAHIRKGKYRFEITADSFEPFTTPWIETDTPNLVFRLKRKATEQVSCVSGIVVDTGNQPMAGLYVTAQTESSRARCETGVDGTFKIESPDAGSCDLLVSSKRWKQDPEYVLREPAKVTLSPVQPITGVRLTVVPGVDVSGTVVDGQTHEPMPYTRILATKEQQSECGAVADDRGSFTLRGMQPDDYKVELRATGMRQEVETKLTVPSWAPLDNVVLVFDLPLVCRGVVVDAQDQPAPGALVLFCPSERIDYPCAVFADSQGRFCVSAQKGDALYLQASADGRLSRRVGPIEADSSGNRLELLDAGRIEGTVVDQNGTPLPHHSVVAAVSTDPALENIDLSYYGKDDNIEGMRAVTRSSGYFTFYTVRPGQYRLDVYPSMGSPAVPIGSASVSVFAGQTLETQLIVDTSAFGGICGTVSIDGRPAEGVRVSVNGQSWVSRRNATVTDNAGQYSFPCVMPGMVDVVVQVFFDGSDGVSNRTQTVEVVAGDTKTVDFPLATERGTIKGNIYLNGEPWRCMASIVIEPTPSSEGMSPVKTQTDQEGHFSAGGLPSGTYMVQCVLGDTSCASSTVELGENQTQQVDLSISSGAIRGRVTGGRASQQVFVLLLPGSVNVGSFTPQVLAQLEDSVIQRHEVDQSGTFNFDIIPGAYLVAAVVIPAGTALDNNSVLQSLQAGKFNYADVVVTSGQTIEVDLPLSP